MSKSWDLLITAELLEQIQQASAPARLQGIVRERDRVAVITATDGPEATAIGFGWRESFAPTPPSNGSADRLLLVAPAIGEPAARRGVEPALVHVYTDAHRFSRIETLVNVSRLAGMSVTVIGCGAMGGTFVRELAACGVGTLHLADRDFLQPVNVARHACDVRDLWRPKVDAVADLARYRNPAVRVDTSRADICDGEGYNWLLTAVAASDLTVALTDSNRAQRVVNSVVIAAAKPALFAGAFERAASGEVCWVFPGGSEAAARFGSTPCWSCIFGSGRVDDPPRRQEDSPCLTLNPDPGFAGTGVDLGYLTYVALAYALAILEPESERAAALIAGKPNLTYANVGNRPDWILRAPFDHFPQMEARDLPRCPVCGDAAAPQPEDL